MTERDREKLDRQKETKRPHTLIDRDRNIEINFFFMRKWNRKKEILTEREREGGGTGTGIGRERD